MKTPLLNRHQREAINIYPDIAYHFYLYIEVKRLKRAIAKSNLGLFIEKLLSKCLID